MNLAQLLPYLAKLSPYIKGDGKLGKAALTAGAWYAGAHYGPYAGDAVRNYGPAVLDFLARFIGG